MYITRIELHNIRCFGDLVIDLKRDNGIIHWTTVLGDNAVGKSTILRCIAMGLCDETSAGALMKETKGEYLRKGELFGYIKITLESNVDKLVEIKTNLRKKDIDDPVNINQEISDNLSPWKDLFICAYGASISGGGSEGYDRYKPLEAVYTLFNPTSELQNPEVLMLRQSALFRDWLGKKLLNILMLEKYEFIYNKKGMFLSGSRGEFGIDELSDGYRMMSLRIFDFFGWAILADRLKMDDDEMVGILLFDELETHIHPKWQRNIVDRLRKQFPLVQIIITSHSPIIALGTADLDNALMVELEFDPSNEKAARDTEVEAEKYKGLTVDQILTSPPFNLSIARSGPTGDMILRFQFLLLKQILNKTEKDEFEQLKIKIKELPDVFETMENLRIHNEIRQLIASSINDSNQE